MDERYKEYAQFFKVLSDPNRLMIVDMLSCGELCACVILLKFRFSQPTLSHHMKSLCECGLVVGRKKGRWMYYSLNEEIAQGIRGFLDEVMTSSADCICHAETIKEASCP
jgi:ArsR family transcriptional regulator